MYVIQLPPSGKVAVQHISRLRAEEKYNTVESIKVRNHGINILERYAAAKWMISPSFSIGVSFPAAEGISPAHLRKTDPSTFYQCRHSDSLWLTGIRFQPNGVRKTLVRL